MGRYVVLEFDDNADAEAFLKGTERGHIDDNKIYRSKSSIRVVGLFARPGRTCSCRDRQHGNHRDPRKAAKRGVVSAIVEGPKFGWWVCTVCKKPRKGGHLLRNLLDSSTHAEGPSYDGFETIVTGLDVTGVDRKTQLKRDKALRNKEMRH